VSSDGKKFRLCKGMFCAAKLDQQQHTDINYWVAEFEFEKKAHIFRSCMQTLQTCRRKKENSARRLTCVNGPFFSPLFFFPCLLLFSSVGTEQPGKACRERRSDWSDCLPIRALFFAALAGVSGFGLFFLCLPFARLRVEPLDATNAENPVLVCARS